MKKLFLLIIIGMTSCVPKVELELYSEDGYIFEIVNIEQVKTEMLFGPDKHECKMTLKSRRNNSNEYGSEASKDNTIYTVFFMDACVKYQVGDIMELKLVK